MILDQIIQYKTHKYNICFKLLADSIKKKYLMQYINLDKWLFKYHHRHQLLLERQDQGPLQANQCLIYPTHFYKQFGLLCV